MVAVPPLMPETVPDVLPITAMPVLLLLQVPPGVASLRVVVLPWQTLFVPIIADGGADTVTVVVTTQPDGAV